MNTVEFKRFQSAIQWAADEARKDTGSMHYQGDWGQGKVLDAVLDPTDFDAGVSWLNGTKLAPIMCNSNMCLAGNGVIAEGDKFVVDYEEVDEFDEEVMSATLCIDREGVVHNIETRAMKLFGLSSSEARDMFNGNNSLDEIISVGTLIAKRYGFTLTTIR